VKTSSRSYWSAGAAGPVVSTGSGVIVSLVHDALGIDPHVAGEQNWQDRALCAQTDPEAFFPEKGGSTREAKRVCCACDVRAECLQYAFDHDERFGIWGGLSERERRRLHRTAPGDVAVPQPAVRGQLCPGCSQVKPLTAFHRNASHKSGYASRCAECINTALRARRDAQQRGLDLVA
jgi:WhiB family transcriptional regulator, redox-sensing transcriptional regulator